MYELTCEIRANQRLPLRLTPRKEELPYARDDELAPPPRSPLPRDDEEGTEDEDRDELRALAKELGRVAVAVVAVVAPPARPVMTTAEDCPSTWRDGHGSEERECGEIEPEREAE